METLTFDNLLMGEAHPYEITVGANQTIQKGDLLELAETPVADTGEGAVTGTAVTVNSETHAATVTEGSADTGDGSIGVTEAASFVRPSAKANIFSVYAVAAEAVTTGSGETAVIVAYIKGEFNEAAMRFGGSSTANQNRFALAKQGIILRAAVPA